MFVDAENGIKWCLHVCRLHHTANEPKENAIWQYSTYDFCRFRPRNQTFIKYHQKSSSHSHNLQSSHFRKISVKPPGPPFTFTEALLRQLVGKMSFGHQSFRRVQQIRLHGHVGHCLEDLVVGAKHTERCGEHEDIVVILFIYIILYNYINYIYIFFLYIYIFF